jgi:hypothetical protein
MEFSEILVDASCRCLTRLFELSSLIEIERILLFLFIYLFFKILNFFERLANIDIMSLCSLLDTLNLNFNHETEISYPPSPSVKQTEKLTHQENPSSSTKHCM